VKFLSAITSPRPRSGGRSISRGYLALFATVIIWSLPSLFQFYLLRYYDVWAQNFYRYSVACIAIAPFVAFRIRRAGPRLDLRAFALCLIPAVPNVVHQITQTIALFYIGPGVYAIFTRSSVIMTAMAISSRHFAGISRRRWGLLVSTRDYRRARRYSRIVDCLHRYHLLGTLRCPGKTSVRSARFHS